MQRVKSRKALPGKAPIKAAIKDFRIPEEEQFFGKVYPEWFLVLWGFLRAYCHKKISITPVHENYAANYPEAAILERVAGLIQTAHNSGSRLEEYVPKTLRDIAQYIRDSGLNGDIPNPREFVLQKGTDLFVRRISTFNDLLSLQDRL